MTGYFLTAEFIVYKIGVMKIHKIILILIKEILFISLFHIFFSGLLLFLSLSLLTSLTVHMWRHFLSLFQDFKTDKLQWKYSCWHNALDR